MTATHPFLEDEWSRAHRSIAKILAELLAGGGREHEPWPLAKQTEEPGIWGLKDKRDRVPIDNLDCSNDRVELFPLWGSHGRVEAPVDIPFDGGRIKRRPIVKLYALSQPEGDAFAPFLNLPAFSKLGMDREIRPIAN